MHNPINVDHGYRRVMRRVMHRVSLAGERPR